MNSYVLKRNPHASKIADIIFEAFAHRYFARGLFGFFN